MKLSAVAIAVQGLGFAPASMAVHGLRPEEEDKPQGGGTVIYFSPLRLPGRNRKRREREFLAML